MNTIGKGSRTVLAAVAACVLLPGLLPIAALAQAPGADPQAVSLLKACTTYLAGQSRFSVDAQSTIEAVLASGQKIQYDHTALVSVQRPNKLRAERRGDLVDQVFYYDGKTLALANPGDRYYAAVPAPGTLEGMMDFARESLDIIAPAGDLLYKNAFEVLTENVTSGFVVGKGVVDGARCDHLAFRTPETDWQIWIQEGDKPLPRKLVITSTDVEGAPQFSVVMTNWNLQPKLNDEMFEFTPPKDAKKVDFLTVRAGAPAAR